MIRLYYKNKRFWLIYFIALGLIFFSIYCWPYSLDGDEEGFLEAGRIGLQQYLFDFLGHLNASNSFWKDTYGNFGNANPRIGSYIFGILWYATALIDNFSLRILVIRLLVAFIGAGCVALISKIAAELGGKTAGFLAPALLMLNPLFFGLQAALLLELPMIFFILLALNILVRINKNLGSENFNWNDFIIFGVYAGLAIGIKLYAFTLFPTFWSLLLINYKKLGRRWFPAASVPVVVAAVIFIISNPVFFQNFWGGWYDLSVGHVNISLGRVNLFIQPFAVKELLFTPFIVYSPKAFYTGTNEATITPNSMFYLISCLLGYGLFLVGLVRSLIKKQFLPALYFVFTFLMTAYVISFFNPGWSFPRIHTTIVPSLVLIYAFIL